MFGSYADGTCTEDSDLDLLVEFKKPYVSLFTLSELKSRLEELFGKPVDVLHAPLPDSATIEIESERTVYETT